MSFPLGAIVALSAFCWLSSATAQSTTPDSIQKQLDVAQQQWQQFDYIAALQSYEQLLTNHPENIEALQGRWRVWSMLGLSEQAAQQAAEYLPDSSALQQLHEDSAALRIRQTEQEYFAIPQQRYACADSAIAMVKANLARYPQSQRSQWDWIRALSNRERNQEALQAYEVLLASDNTVFNDIPAYVHAAAGQSYFAQKRPDLARIAYDYALKKEPDSLKAQIGMFYALSDMGEFDAANQWIQAAAAQPRAPDEAFNLITTAINGIAYAGDLSSAQGLYQNLQQQVPNSTPLHIAMGRVYAWRGWTERAKEEILAAERRSPLDVRAQNALVELELNQGDYAAADQRLARLEVIAPDDPDVKNLQRARTLRDMNSLSLSVRGTRTKDSAGSNTGAVFDAKWIAPPIGLSTRPYVRTYLEQGEVDAVKTEYQRLGLGLEHRIANVGSVQAELQQEMHLKKENSFILGGSWMLDDYWQIDGQWDSNSVEVPLRARADDVSGWKAQIGVRYRAHESATTRFNYAEQHHSDSNLRRTIALDGNYTLFKRPSLKGVLGLEWAATNNSLRDTPYFNPRSDQTLQMSWNTEWLQQMPLDRTFKQQLVLAAGVYAQEGFDSGTIGSVSYQHDWKLNDVSDLRYGIAYVRRLYDGQVTQGPEANLSFNWRF